MNVHQKSIVRMAEALKALGHPVRIEILRIISNSGSGHLNVTQIRDILGITQPETSKHLSVLKNRSILVCERKEGYAFYHINPELGFIRQILNSLKK